MHAHIGDSQDGSGLSQHWPVKLLTLDFRQIPRLTSTEIVTLPVRFCLNDTYVTFRGDFYQKSFSTAKGSPVSVTTADLVMEDIEQRALSSLHMFWKRYHCK